MHDNDSGYNGYVSMTCLSSLHTELGSSESRERKGFILRPIWDFFVG
jgi:hypothetical protein